MTIGKHTVRNSLGLLALVLLALVLLASELRAGAQTAHTTPRLAADGAVSISPSVILPGVGK